MRGSFSAKTSDRSDLLVHIMTEVNPPPQVLSIDDKFDLILKKFDDTKQDIDGKINGLRSEFNHTTQDVKQLKTEQHQWKRVGNKDQFNFNGELLDLVKQAIWASENSKFTYSQEQMVEIKEKLERRNKLIKIADTSEGGWETVRSYTINDLASDSEDDKKITRAEYRAVRKIKQRKVNYKKNAPATRSHPYSLDRPAYTGYARQPFLVGQHDKKPGSCYNCGDFSHWKRDCPYATGTYSCSTESYQQPTANKRSY